jgi:hypothetical protein
MTPPYGYVQINNVSYRQPNGSLELSQTYLSGYGGVSITNTSMRPPVMPTIAFENVSNCPTLVYAAWGRAMVLNISYYFPSYFVYWLDGAYNFRFSEGHSGYFRYGGVFPDGTGYEDSNVPLDTNWHWFAVRVINATATYGVPRAEYVFYIDGVQQDADIDSWDSNGQPVLPTTFLTVNYGTIDAAYSNWQIDYLRTSAYTEYPPEYPYMKVVPVDLISSDIVMLAIGLIGAMMDVVAPVYTVETFMDGDYVNAFGIGFLMMLLGTAFIVAWLW